MSTTKLNLMKTLIVDNKVSLIGEDKHAVLGHEVNSASTQSASSTVTAETVQK